MSRKNGGRIEDKIMSSLKVVEKYHGEVFIETEDHIFAMTVIMNLEQQGKNVMKDKKVLAGLFVLFILLMTGMILFLPRPIAKAADEVVVHRIQYNTDFSQDGAEADFMEIEDYDAEKIVACLSSYRERRTMTKAESYQMDNVEIRIIVSINGEMREILLGKENCSRGGYGTYQYEIVNAEKLCEELRCCILGKTDANADDSFKFTKKNLIDVKNSLRYVYGK